MADHVSTARALAASLVLLAATLAALAIANSPWADTYKAVLATRFGFEGSILELSYPLKDWIKNALMAVFFLLVGLEIKAEFLVGVLADRARAVLPFAAAVGGMAVPALLFLALTSAEPGLARGWAIPSATDIAFAVGLVGLLGNRVSPAMRALLLAVAVIDDIGAIIIIAVFYTHTLHAGPLLGMGAALGLLALLHARAVTSLWPYLAAGALLWLFALHSGISPTLAGVATAFFVPLKVGDARPLDRLVDNIREPVNFVIMPLFAFANAGIPLYRIGSADLLSPLTAGIIAGLVLGKPIGITAGALAAVRMGVAKLPSGTAWSQVAGIGCVAGIGFTMSLFVGALAFDDEALMNKVTLGVLTGSLISGLAGSLLISALAKRRMPPDG